MIKKHILDVKVGRKVQTKINLKLVIEKGSNIFRLGWNDAFGVNESQVYRPEKASHASTCYVWVYIHLQANIFDHEHEQDKPVFQSN